MKKEGEDAFTKRPRKRDYRDEDANGHGYNSLDDDSGFWNVRLPESKQLGLRIAVLVFAILGCATSGFLGFQWHSDVNRPDMAAMIELFRQIDPGVAKKIESIRTASFFLMLGALPGLAAGVLVFLRIFPKPATINFFLAMMLPAIFEPRSLFFTCPFLVAAIVGLFVNAKRRKGTSRYR